MQHMLAPRQRLMLLQEHDGDPKQGLEVSILLRGLRSTTEGRGPAELRLALRIGELKESSVEAEALTVGRSQR